MSRYPYNSAMIICISRGWQHAFQGIMFLVNEMRITHFKLEIATVKSFEVSDGEMGKILKPERALLLNTN